MKLKSFGQLADVYRVRKPRKPTPKTVICTAQVCKDKNNPEKTTPCGGIMRKIYNTNVFICDTCGAYKLVR